MRVSKRILLAGAGLIAASAAIAQSDNEDRGEELQRELEDRAIRVPIAPPGAADEAAETQRARSAPAPRAVPSQLVRRPPNWSEVREDLQDARERDTAEAAQEAPQQTQDPTRALPPPSKPGLRAAAQDMRAKLQQAEVDRVLIPLLIPAALRDEIKIYGMRNVYTATTGLDQNASISISGSCNRIIGGDPDVVEARRRLAEAPPRLPGLGADYYISRNDFGVDLSFSKFGCGYVMTIECNNPSADPRCAADEYITELADSMVLANPELAEAAQ